MFTSPRLRGAIGLVATTLLITQGCFVYRPAALPVPAGSPIRVEGARLEIYDGPVVHPPPAECHGVRVEGRLSNAKRDTLTIVRIRAMNGDPRRRVCSYLSTATIVALADSDQVLARHFSAWRTTGLVVGAFVLVSVISAGVSFAQFANSHDGAR